MAGELFKAMSGTDIVHVPHKASGEARNSVIGGHVQMMFDAVTTMTATTPRTGKVKPLGDHRERSASDLTPDVPTVSEAGVPGYEATIWLGIDGAGQDPAGRHRQAQCRDHQGGEPAGGAREPGPSRARCRWRCRPKEFDAYLRKDIDKWADVVKKTGAKAN